MTDPLPSTILVGAVLHESNTFTGQRTSLAEFAPVYGDAIREQSKWMKGSAAGGILNTLSAAGMRAVPSVFGHALPSGIVERSAYDSLCRLLLAVLDRERVDGVCLALHGSMCVEGIDDPEGDLLTTIRNRVGPDVPVVCALDMHASMTDKMVNAANAFTAYRTAPHTDQFSTGVRAANLMLRVLQEQLQVETVFVPIPMLIAGEQSESATEPMRSLIAEATAVSEATEIMSADYLLGFPWADYPHNRASVIVVGERRLKAALQETAQALACRFWRVRKDFGFTTEALPLDKALDEAAHATHSPVLIADSGDNPTAGASEDLVGVLARLLERRTENALVAVIADADAVDACKAVHPGARVKLSLGRVAPEEGSLPLALEAKLSRVGRYADVECAVIEVRGITVVVTRDRAEVTDPALLDALGIPCHHFRLCILKSGYLSPAYSAVAARKILALTPGETDERLHRLDYQRTLRPVFPLDEKASLPHCE